jgi:hypothetical protein
VVCAQFYSAYSVFPSTFTLSSHVKSFHAGLNPLTLCLTFDRRAFLVTGSVTGSDSESSPLSADELHDLSADSTLDGALEEPGALLVELKKTVNSSLVAMRRHLPVATRGISACAISALARGAEPFLNGRVQILGGRPPSYVALAQTLATCKTALQ